jgi:hypothetical protein
VEGGDGLYAILGVEPDVDADALRAAFRRRAAALHPDRGVGGRAGHVAMVELNQAWAVLGDPERRAEYDDGRRRGAAPPATPTAPASPAAGPDLFGTRPPPPPTPGSPQPGTHPRVRREAWLAGVRVQVVRLATQAGRSAALGLAVRRKGLPRAEYLSALEVILAELTRDTDRRVRMARAAGAAPLDIGLVSALVGLHAIARGVGPPPADPEAARRQWAVAEMLDRMWDTMAYEVPREVERAVGGNPHVARRLAS